MFSASFIYVFDLLYLKSRQTSVYFKNNSISYNSVCLSSTINCYVTARYEVDVFANVLGTNLLDEGFFDYSEFILRHRHLWSDAKRCPMGLTLDFLSRSLV